MSSNAWTEGEWQRRGWSVYADDGERVANCISFSKSSEAAKADAALIALAPEMAEAIMEPERDKAFMQIASLRHRLRAIDTEATDE